MSNRQHKFWIEHTARLAAAIIYILAAILFCSLFSSCRSACGVTEADYLRDTVRIVDHQRDSVCIFDSIYLREYVKGDTVYLEHYRWRTKYKEVLRLDTVYQTRVQQEVRTVEVERKLTTWQKVRLYMGDILLLLLLLVTIYIIYKIYRRIA